MLTRRHLIAAAAGTAAVLSRLTPADGATEAPARAGPFTPVHTPNGVTLPHKVVTAVS